MDLLIIRGCGGLMGGRINAGNIPAGVLIAHGIHAMGHTRNINPHWVWADFMPGNEIW